MNIVVCIKQVPDSMDVRVDPETGTLVREGVPAILNPFDEFALEEGLQIRGKVGGTVTALTMGPPQADDVLRTALGMGVDKAVLLSDRAFAGSDTLATSYTLAKGIEHVGDVDVVITGKQAIDGDTAQVGPGIASRLGFTQLTYVSKVENIDPGSGTITVERLLDGGRERVEAKLPVMLAVVKDINVPRKVSILKMKKARNVEIPTWGASEIGVDPELIGQKGSPTWVERVFSPEQKSGGEIVQADNDECADRITDLVLDLISQ